MENSVSQNGAGAETPLDPYHAALKTRYERLSLKTLDFLERVLDRADEADMRAEDYPSDRNCAHADRAVVQAGALVSKLVWAHQTLVVLRTRALDASIDRPRAAGSVARPGPRRQGADAGAPVAAMAAEQANVTKPASPPPAPINIPPATPSDHLSPDQPVDAGMAGGDRVLPHDGAAGSRAPWRCAVLTPSQTALNPLLALDLAGDAPPVGELTGSGGLPDLPGSVRTGANRAAREPVPERMPERMLKRMPEPVLALAPD